jgi:prepilin-type N-terminal cleavage/methylation domain-containing protein
MNLPKRSISVRPGFTLVELLVAIAIIGILLAMLVPAVMRIYGVGTQVVAQNDINQLETAVQNFKVNYKVEYIPSQIKMCELFSQYAVVENGVAANAQNPLDRASVDFLTHVWPKLLSPLPGQVNSQWQSAGIDWNGDGTTTTPPVILEGHQALVYFLGGVPLHSPAPGCFGFSTDSRDPVKLSQTQGRTSPFFEFGNTGRLAFVPNNAGNTGYYSFFDPYKQYDPPQFQNGDQPYAYFSNYGTRNGYSKFGLTSDCPTLGVTPYASSLSPAIQYYNPQSYQILSAGADRKFGPGSFATKTPVLWTPQTAGSIDPRGRDDHSNFSSGSLLGVGQ